jgi:glycosyltransferase involved in cell wall biosynthesis
LGDFSSAVTKSSGGLREVILSANVPHYQYLARALESAGLLKTYITSISLLEDESVPRLLSRYWSKKLEGRRLRGLCAAKIRRLWLPEVLQRGLPALGMVSAERANWINNYLFDWMAAHLVDQCSVFHFVSSVGLYSARKAKSLGATIVCDVRQAHPVVARNILEREARAFGVKCEIAGRSYESRLLQEFEIADYLVVPSSATKATFVTAGVPGDRMFVVPYGADLGHFRKREREDSVFRILYVGQLTLGKGIQYLLQALAGLNLRGAECVVIGQIDPAVKPLLRRWKGTFRHIGSVPKIELANFYSNSSVLVLPSLVEAFGMVVLEAMACGVPVIVSSEVGAKEVFADGVEGFVVPSRDVEALRERIRFLYEDDVARARMSEAAIQCAQGLTWEAYGERIRRLYVTIGDRKKSMARPREVATAASPQTGATKVRNQIS